MLDARRPSANSASTEIDSRKDSLLSNGSPRLPRAGDSPHKWTEDGSDFGWDVRDDGSPSLADRVSGARYQSPASYPSTGGYPSPSSYPASPASYPASPTNYQSPGGRSVTNMDLHSALQTEPPSRPREWRVAAAPVTAAPARREEWL